MISSTAAKAPSGSLSEPSEPHQVRATRTWQFGTTPRSGCMFLGVMMGAANFRICTATAKPPTSGLN